MKAAACPYLGKKLALVETGKKSTMLSTEHTYIMQLAISHT
jgi:hypothetical protein